MAIRIRCRSCSANLSVRDEFVRRAVRCPKCRGVMPAPVARPAASVAAPPPPPRPSPPPIPIPERSPFPALNEPAKPAEASKITGKPAPRSRSDDEGDRPVKRRWDACGDGRHDREKKTRGSNALIVLGLLLLTGGAGYGGHWFMTSKEAVYQGAADVRRASLPVTLAHYDQLNVGASTRADAELSLGGGKVATTDDLKTAFGADQKRIDAWAPKVAAGRAVVWRNGDDRLLAAFHPTASAAGRLQMKEWRSKTAAPAPAGEPDDAKFVATYPPGRSPTAPAVPGSAVEMTAEQLAREYETDARAADAKYKGKTLVISGRPWLPASTFDRIVNVTMWQSKNTYAKIFAVSCVITNPASGNGIETAGRGSHVRLAGQCKGRIVGDDNAVTLIDCEVLTVTPPEVLTVTATDLFAEIAKNPDAARTKYLGKQLRITGARVDQVAGRLLYLGESDKKVETFRLLVIYQPDSAKPFAGVKVGDRINVRGEGTSSMLLEELTISWATIVP